MPDILASVGTQGVEVLGLSQTSILIALTVAVVAVFQLKAGLSEAETLGLLSVTLRVSRRPWQQSGSGVTVVDGVGATLGVGVAEPDGLGVGVAEPDGVGVGVGVGGAATGVAVTGLPQAL